MLIAGQTLAAQDVQKSPSNQPIIERLEFIGCRRVESGTIRAHISLRTGDPYDAEQVERDAQALRDAGFFDEVRYKVVDSPDDPNGKIVIFYLTEKPIIRRIEYRGIRSITDQDLLRAYQEKKIGLAVETYFDQTKLTRAADVIKELLAAHGHPSASVVPTYEKVGATNTVTILFSINEGPKQKD